MLNTINVATFGQFSQSVTGMTFKGSKNEPKTGDQVFFKDDDAKKGDIVVRHGRKIEVEDTNNKEVIKGGAVKGKDIGPA
ncbi:MAG: hypothetical protein AB7P76_11760 [Candidatus Melainabacteria bacterium]